MGDITLACPNFAMQDSDKDKCIPTLSLASIYMDKLFILGVDVFVQVSLFRGEDGGTGETGANPVVSYRDLYQGNFLRDVIKQM